MSNKYEDIYNNMIDNKWMTAAELGIASASLRAMETRGLVEVNRAAKPMLYRKVGTNGQSYFTKIAALNNLHSESKLVVVWYDNRYLGETIEQKNDGEWYHCDGKRKLTAEDYEHIIEGIYYKGGNIAASFKLEERSLEKLKGVSIN